MTRWVDGVAIVVWNCTAWVIWGAAIVEVVRTPARYFARGWRTKTSRLVVIAMLSGVIAGLYLPVGAAVVLAGVRRSRRPSQPVEPNPPNGPRLPRSEGGFLPREDD